MTARVSRYHVATRPFLDRRDGDVKRLVFASRTANVMVVSDALWSSMLNARFHDIPDDLFDQLRAAELIVDEGAPELDVVLTRHRGAVASDQHLALVVQPTASCQLGCGYCGQLHSLRWLSRDHQRDFIALADKRLSSKPYRSLGVCWFGAEPLAGLGVMRKMSPGLKELAAAHGCTYSASIVTNGLALSPPIATELQHDHAISSITVSLDGTKEAHDARRHTKAGGETFDRIFRNLVALCKRDDLTMDIDVRCNVDRRNCDAVVPLLELLASEGVQRRIHFYVAPIHSWGNDAHQLSLDPQEFADREIEWFVRMLDLGFPISLVPALSPIVCIAVEPDSVLIDATGELYNCTEVSYVPTYGNPNEFSIGRVANGEIPGARDRIGDFNDRVAAGAYACSSCRMLPVCGGACPKEWLEGREPCPSAKRNIEQRLLLAYATSLIAEQPTDRVPAGA
jgi:uncharacterized protein